MLSPSEGPSTLGIVGGTGPEGKGLAVRFARAGYRILLGSRSLERAEEAVAQMSDGSGAFEGVTNEGAVTQGDVIFLTLPYAGLAETLPPLAAASAGKIVISTIAPIEYVEGRPRLIDVPAGSAAETVQKLLPKARVVSAFQVIDSHQLLAEGPIETDVLVASDDAEARREVMSLARQIPGVQARSAGRLAASQFIEPYTGVLITLNRIYKAHTGVRITGLR